jgi:hypothetical protein
MVSFVFWDPIASIQSDVKFWEMVSATMIIVALGGACFTVPSASINVVFCLAVELVDVDVFADELVVAIIVAFEVVFSDFKFKAL